jgi:putative molybdopterin biosynthesis protein
MVQVRFHYTWLPDQQASKSREMQLFALLEGIHRDGSLRAAAKQASLSYRYAWGLIGRWADYFGQPLVQMERGRGAQLTALGSKLLGTQQRVQARLAPQIETLSAELEREFAGMLDSEGARLNIMASHDLALTALRDYLAKHDGPRLDIHFRGSADCLVALAAGQVEVAGFHLGRDADKAALHYRKCLKSAVIALIRFVTRAQGLIVARGNPMQIRSLADLARRGVRFINRQPGSGTRLAFDRLLDSSGIRSGRIQGYQHEEFTHLAVAATVASNHADAGIGIEAAARQFQLDFVPLYEEQYFLACRKELLAAPKMQSLIGALKKSALRSAIAKIPGYGVASLGEICDIDTALPTRD